MSEDSGAELELFNSAEHPAIEKFPTLKPLTYLDGSEVKFIHGDNEYMISSLKYALPPNLYEGEERYLFCIWEIENGVLIPNGFIEYSDKDETTCNVGQVTFLSTMVIIADDHPSFFERNEKTEKFFNFNESFDTGYVGMKVDPPGQGLGTVIFTASLAAMQNEKFEIVEIYRDETKSQSIKLTEEGIPNILSSFYAKYSTEGVKTPIKEEGAGPEHTILKMPTTLSTMHLSILNETFGKAQKIKPD